MKRFLISSVLGATGLYLATTTALADKGAPAKGGTTTTAAPATKTIKLSDLKPGAKVRVKYRNEWVDGTVVEGGTNQIRVQIGGDKESFMAEKVWGTEEQQDNEAAGGYLDPEIRSQFEKFKEAVANLESVKQSGGDVNAAIEEAAEILRARYGKAGQHPRVGPYLARFWAVATSRIDAMAAVAAEEAEKAAEKGDTNFFAGYLYARLDRAKEVLAEYRAFQTEANAETERLDKVIETAKQRIDAAHAKAKEAGIAAARLPKEVYKGADKKSLKAKVTAEWKKQFPNRPILKLIVITDWVRDRSWKTNASSAGGYWYDWTSISMNLVVKKDANTATVYPVGVSYEKNDKKKLVMGVSEKGFGNLVPFDMLLKNVGK